MKLTAAESRAFARATAAPAQYNELEVRIVGAREVDVGDRRRIPERFFAVAWMEPGDLVQTGAKAAHVTFWNETVVRWNHGDVLRFDDDVLLGSCLNLQLVSTGGPMADPTSSTGEYVVASARVRPPRVVSDHFLRWSVPLERQDEVRCKLEIELRLSRTGYFTCD